jgi:hypothetical protein
MPEVIECPLCKTRVVIGNGNRCPACRRDVTDQEAIHREERIERIYGLLWEQHQAGKSLRAAVTEVRTDLSWAAADIEAAQAAFLDEGRRKFLHRGKRHLQTGFLFVLGGIGCALLQLFLPIPFIIVSTGAIAFGLCDFLFGVYEVLKYWYYFLR